MVKTRNTWKYQHDFDMTQDEFQSLSMLRLQTFDEIWTFVKKNWKTILLHSQPLKEGEDGYTTFRKQKRGFGDDFAVWDSDQSHVIRYSRSCVSSELEPCLRGIASHVVLSSQHCHDLFRAEAEKLGMPNVPYPISKCADYFFVQRYNTLRIGCLVEAGTYVLWDIARDPLIPEKVMLSILLDISTRLWILQASLQFVHGDFHSKNIIFVVYRNDEQQEVRRDVKFIDMDCASFQISPLDKLISNVEPLDNTGVAATPGWDLFYLFLSLRHLAHLKNMKSLEWFFVRCQDRRHVYKFKPSLVSRRLMSCIHE